MITNIIIFFVLGLLFGGLSLFIWKYEQLDLISGYEPDKIKDKKGLAKWYGQIMLLIASTAFILSIVNCFFDSFTMDIFSYLGFLLIVVILSIIVTVGGKKYY